MRVIWRGKSAGGEFGCSRSMECVLDWKHWVICMLQGCHFSGGQSIWVSMVIGWVCVCARASVCVLSWGFRWTSTSPLDGSSGQVPSQENELTYSLGKEMGGYQKASCQCRESKPAHLITYWLDCAPRGGRPWLFTLSAICEVSAGMWRSVEGPLFSDVSKEPHTLVSSVWGTCPSRWWHSVSSKRRGKADTATQPDITKPLNSAAFFYRHVSSFWWRAAFGRVAELDAQ